MSMHVSRRSVLLASAALPLGAITACQSSPGPTPTNDDDASVKASVAVSERELIARYRATIAAFPALRPRLAGILTQHEEHLTGMGGDPLTMDMKGYVVPENQTQAVTELVAAERTAARDRTQSCTAAKDTELAWALALISASEASHAEFLRLRVLT